MITEADILLLHEFSICDYGGAKEVRDRHLLLSAIARPFQTFDGMDLYPSPYDKAAALGESLIINHPFLDGNKRTAMLAMLALLSEFGITVIAGPDELYDLIIGMSVGDIGHAQIVTWLQQNVQR